MQQASHAVLSLSDPRDGGPWVLRIVHERSVTEPLKAVRAAALEFLATPEGRGIAESNHGDFNYGDAALEIPRGILLKHGITGLEISDECWSDSHDHNFAAELSN